MSPRWRSVKCEGAKSRLGAAPRGRRVEDTVQTHPGRPSRTRLTTSSFFGGISLNAACEAGRSPSSPRVVTSLIVWRPKSGTHEAF